MGDAAGIGPEITDKAWNSLSGDTKNCFFIIADPALYRKAKVIEKPQQAVDIFQTALPVLPIACPKVIAGQPQVNAAKVITKSIDMAVNFALSGQASAVVTNPIAKDILYGAGFEFPGHTEYLAELTKDHNPPYARGPIMMLSAQDLRVALATIHISIFDVPRVLNSERIIHAAQVLHGALTTDLGLTNPRIAMTGLNPHAGENGALGSEERDYINPCAEELRKSGINITNAQPADTLFHQEARQGYDAVLAMYHDQGLIPVKSLDFHGGVNSTLGLPIVRTSPDHGTAFNIAGKGLARPNSLIAAMKQARFIARNRRKYA